jgi:hypothetical protein
MDRQNASSYYSQEFENLEDAVSAKKISVYFGITVYAGGFMFGSCGVFVGLLYLCTKSKSYKEPFVCFVGSTLITRLASIVLLPILIHRLSEASVAAQHNLDMLKA